MAQKDKKIYPNKLLKIREHLGYTQKEMAKILDVSERMICNYETEVTNLPIDKAMFLCSKYNYSLDWIYCNIDIPAENQFAYKNISQLDKFVVDIRHFISCSNKMIHITIPENYWKYIQELNNILSSNLCDSEKKRTKAELDGKYIGKDRDKKVWRISISQENISSFFHSGADFIPYIDKEYNEEYEEISKEQQDEIISFLSTLA